MVKAQIVLKWHMKLLDEIAVNAKAYSRFQSKHIISQFILKESTPNTTKLVNHYSTDYNTKLCSLYVQAVTSFHD